RRHRRIPARARGVRGDGGGEEIDGPEKRGQTTIFKKRGQTTIFGPQFGTAGDKWGRTTISKQAGTDRRLRRGDLSEQATAPAWPRGIYDVLLAQKVRQVAYVPDAGHSELIKLCQATEQMATISLTTEEEGVSMLAGAWLGGERGVLLMQSS